jgi:hypothetical protein
MSSLAATMHPMSTRKTRGGDTSPGKTPDANRKPRRSGVPFHLYIKRSLKLALERFLAKQRFGTTQTDVIEVILTEFLTKEGEPPNPADDLPVPKRGRPPKS